MADKPTLHVAVNRPSSLMNGSMVPGAVIGSVVGSVVGMPVVGAAAGGTIGGFLQKNQEDKNIARTGKVIEEVKPPTIFNREMAIAGAGAAALTGVVGAALTGGLGALGVGIATITGALPVLALGAVGLAVFSAAPVIGGMVGKGRMEREYADAQVVLKQQAAESQLARARANAANNIVPIQRSMQPNYKDTVPLAEIQAAQNAAPMQGGMAEKVLAARQQQHQLAPTVAG
jgi:hypothetical protein